MPEESYLSYIKSTANFLISFTLLSISSLGALLYFYQKKLIYPSEFPEGSRQITDTPDKYNLPFKEIYITTPDNVKIHAFFIHQTNPKLYPTIIFCHANAGNMGHRLPIIKMLYDYANVFVFSYRGYGMSSHSPSESGLKVDVRTVLNYVLSMEINTKNLVLFGQSLGGAVAIDLAAENESLFRALILENTFLSLPKVVPYVMPFLKHASFLCTEVWNSEKRIKLINNLPVLFLASDQDEIVPHQHMIKLYDILPSEKKVFSVIKGGTHNDSAMFSSYWKSVKDFWKEYVDE